MTWWKRNHVSGHPHHGAASHIGRVRAENQDAYGHFAAESEADHTYLYIVADGMGGHAHGREASHIAVEVVRRAYFADLTAPPEERLQSAFEQANRTIFERGLAEGPYEVMGTTCTALAYEGDRLYFAHVGDSRLYRISRAEVALLTTDHTYAEALRQQGTLTADEIRNHPRRHTLLRAMGIDSEIELDVVDLGTPTPDDAFLLATDGLAGVESEIMQKVVRGLEPQTACERLIDLANDAGGRDNITVLIVRFDG